MEKQTQMRLCTREVVGVIEESGSALIGEIIDAIREDIIAKILNAIDVFDDSTGEFSHEPSVSSAPQTEPYTFLCEFCGWHRKTKAKVQVDSVNTTTVPPLRSELIVAHDIRDEHMVDVIHAVRQQLSCDLSQAIRKDVIQKIERSVMIPLFDDWWDKNAAQKQYEIDDHIKTPRLQSIEQYDAYLQNIRKKALKYPRDASRVLGVKLNVDKQEQEYFELRESSIHGYGLFLRKALPSNIIMFSYKGEIISEKKANRREIQYKQKGKLCYFFALSSGEVIDATSTGNYARFINHSCDVSVVIYEHQTWRLYAFSVT